jgi:non-homologous end joining protein Ku
VAPVIQEKIEHIEEKAPAPSKKKPTYVIDLVSVLQRSIQQTQAKPKLRKAAKKTRTPRRRVA